METIKGGHPDRFVKQYEYMDLILDPILDHCGGFCNPGERKGHDWGVTVYWQEGTPGPFPVCEGDTKLIKDITLWKEVLKTPDPRQYSAEEWKAAEDLISRYNELVFESEAPAAWFVIGNTETAIEENALLNETLLSSLQTASLKI